MRRSSGSGAPWPSPATGWTAGAPTGGCARRTGCWSSSAPGTPGTARRSPPARARSSRGGRTAPARGSSAGRRRRLPLPPRPHLRHPGDRDGVGGARYPLGRAVGQGRAGGRPARPLGAALGRRPRGSGPPSAAAPPPRPRDTAARYLGRAARPPRLPRRHVAAPVREQLAAACVLASGWDGTGPVVDPMCGSGTLLIEAAWFALGWAPGRLRRHWAFERLPGFDPGPSPPSSRSRSRPPARTCTSMATTSPPRRSTRRAPIWSRRTCSTAPRSPAATPPRFEPPPGPGLVVINPPHGERLEAGAGRWRALGDLLKTALQGMEGRGRWPARTAARRSACAPAAASR